MKIRGIPVGTTMPRSDWNQADPRKADYIKNKPDFTPASHETDKENPHKVTAEQVGAVTAAEIGIKEGFVLFPFVVYTDAYHGVDGVSVDQVGCSVYRLYLGEELKHLYGKTLKIKTYAYGDMAYGFEGEPGTRINPGADIVRDPQSGVCEFEVTLPEYDPETLGDFFHISFCDNQYTEIEIIEKPGMIWDEIKTTRELVYQMLQNN